MQLETEFVYILKLNREEVNLLRTAIGKTSINGRFRAGMSQEESEFFSKLYETLQEKE